MKKLLFTLVLTLGALSLQAQIDRSKMPDAGPAPKINLDKAEQFKLGNGLTVLVVENHKLPRVSIQLDIDPVTQVLIWSYSVVDVSYLGRKSVKAC